MINSINALSQWYIKQCKDDWHEEYGIKIDTLDNPGWSLEIDLNRTNLQDKLFARVRIDRTEDDWLHAWREGLVFHAAGGPSNLEEIIQTFLSWAEIA